MPTHGQLAHHHASHQHPDAYSAGRLRALQGSFEAHRVAERERRAREKEQRADRRWLAAQTRGQAEEQRAAARAEMDALRSSPLYPLWQRWGRRVGNATLYDADAWRKSGRLVPVTDRTRYKGGARREVVDWTDILDREAQELGIPAHDLPREFERMERHRQRALSSLREAEETRRESRQIGSAA